MIKGRYVATVTIDLRYPDDFARGLPLDEMKKRLIANADNIMREIGRASCRERV